METHPCLFVDRAYQIKVEVQGKVFHMALDTGSYASWLLCNYPPFAQGQKEVFYSPKPKNYISAAKYKSQPKRAHTQASLPPLSFKECGPDLEHVCFEIEDRHHHWGRVAAALVEDAFTLAPEFPTSQSVPVRLQFGCGFRVAQRGMWWATGAGSGYGHGVMGLGNRGLSVSKQMADSGLVDHILGFCFAYGVFQSDHDREHRNTDTVGYVVLGRPWDYDDNAYQWIPIGSSPKHGFDVIYFVHMQYGDLKYNIVKESKYFGATIIDTGTMYMHLVPNLFQLVYEIVIESAFHHGYIEVHNYGYNTHYWRSPVLDSYFSIFNHFHEMKLFFNTEYEEKYTFHISPFGYLHIVDTINIPVENRILHQYIVALAVLEKTEEEDQDAFNVIGGIALRGNKLIIDHVKQRIGFKPEYKCAIEG